MPISKNKIKFIRSLEQKKVRREERVFLAEGPKLTADLLGHFRCRYLAATDDWLASHNSIEADEIDTATIDEIARASLLKTPQDVIAIFDQREEKTEITVIEKQLCLALDDVQDPGNLGTIIRIADWFGIEHIFCSTNTVDVYSPKVVQATMGALSRVHLHYVSLTDLIGKLNKNVPIYGTLLDGTNIYTQELSTTGLIVMGNEGNGITAEVRQLINRKLYIPNYPEGRDTSESLNVAIATAVTCAEFRRRE
ncbi:MAG: RNA methyltransferase [Bacteroidaceae bacterium]|nr:RNA methyltransferase [Bacteroidaceae bacterium]MBQ9675486.1 RNA methyltransferase [Bacteroidaceae bacterium]